MNKDVNGPGAPPNCRELWEEEHVPSEKNLEIF